MKRSHLITLNVIVFRGGKKQNVSVSLKTHFLWLHLWHLFEMHLRAVRRTLKTKKMDSILVLYTNNQPKINKEDDAFLLSLELPPLHASLLWIQARLFTATQRQETPERGYGPTASLVDRGGGLNSNDSKKWSLYILILANAKQYCMLGICVTLVPLIRTKLWETRHHQKIKNRKNSWNFGSTVYRIPFLKNQHDDAMKDPSKLRKCAC